MEMITSPEAEAVVIGAILTDPNAVIFVADVIKPDDFTVPLHKWLAVAIWDCFKVRQPPTMAAVIDKLRSSGRWSDRQNKSQVSMADVDAILEATHINDLDFVVHNAGLVKDAAFRRTGYTSLALAARAFTDKTKTADEIQKSVLDTVGTVFDNYGSRDPSLSSIGKEEQERLDKMGDDDIPGVTCGLRWLDELTGGFLPSESWVIAAPYKMRKTTLALNMSLAAAQAGAPVSIFTVGDSSRDATYRKLLSLVIAQEWIRAGNKATDCKISSRALQYKLTNATYLDWRNHCEPILQALPIRLYDGRDMIGNIGEAGRVLRRDVAVHGTRVFVYDFAQAAQCGDKDYERVTRFASWFQQMVGDLGLTGIALSQLNEESVKGYNDDSHSPGAKGGGALPAMANVFLVTHYEEPKMKVVLKLARDSEMGKDVTHELIPQSGLIIG